MYDSRNQFRLTTQCWTTRIRTSNDRAKTCSVTVTPWSNTGHLFLMWCLASPCKPFHLGASAGFEPANSQFTGIYRPSTVSLQGINIKLRVYETRCGVSVGVEPTSSVEPTSPLLLTLLLVKANCISRRIQYLSGSSTVTIQEHLTDSHRLPLALFWSESGTRTHRTVQQCAHLLFTLTHCGREHRLYAASLRPVQSTIFKLPFVFISKRLMCLLPLPSKPIRPGYGIFLSRK